MLATGDVCWLRGYGGVKVDGVARWPARVCDPLDGGEKVQKARKPSAPVLVHSFGDEQFVWAKTEALAPFDADAAHEVAERASAKMRPIVMAAIAACAPESPPAPPDTANGGKRKRRWEADEEELSAYELKRLETMRRNALALEALGVADASSALREATTPDKREVDPAVLAARAQARAERIREAHANRRSSSRLVDRDDATRAPVRFADEYAALEDAEVRILSRVTKRGGKGGGGRRRESVELSAEERASLAAAMTEASGWLGHMRRYFTDKLSEANLRNVMKQATALATGQGVPHTFRSDFFRKGEPVGIDEDLVALRDDANCFLLPEDDPGHGWRLNHPISKMIIFQHHLHNVRKRGQ